MLGVGSAIMDHCLMKECTMNERRNETIKFKICLEAVGNIENEAAKCQEILGTEERILDRICLLLDRTLKNEVRRPVNKSRVLGFDQLMDERVAFKIMDLERLSTFTKSGC